MTDHTRDALDASGEPLGGNMATPSEAEIEKTLQAIAPAELAGGVYVMFSSKIPKRYRLSRGVHGLAGPVLDLQLKKAIEIQGRWAGRAPAILLGDEAIGRDADDIARDDCQMRREIKRQKFWATALHEFAHIVEMGIDTDEPPAIAAKEIEKLCRDRFFDFIKADGKSSVWCPEWSGHGWQFIRLVCHIAGRFEAIGGEILPGPFLYREAYGLGPLAPYRRLLAAEVQALRLATFDEIRERRPPEKFVEEIRWALARWAKYCDRPEKAEWIAHEIGGLVLRSGRVGRAAG